MPVLLYAVADPADLVLQGERMRQESITRGVDVTAPILMAQTAPLFRQAVVFDEEDIFTPMQSDFAFTVGSTLALRPMANAGIVTPCGEFVPVLKNEMMIRAFVQATEQWQIVGTTRDSVGAVLGNCNVIALETGRMNVPGQPVVGMTGSDGGGNYTIPTATNSAHQVIAYKAGPVAGISLNTLTPTQVP